MWQYFLILKIKESVVCAAYSSKKESELLWMPFLACSLQSAVYCVCLTKLSNVGSSYIMKKAFFVVVVENYLKLFKRSTWGCVKIFREINRDWSNNSEKY